MKYTYSNSVAPVVENLYLKITERLKAGKKVLWLMSGGSSATICFEVAKKLQQHNISGLSVTLSDERYGKVGHGHENWQTILDLGLNLSQANLYRPLVDKGLNETVELFDHWLDEQLRETDYTIGLFGVGLDGHTAGIKPGLDLLNESRLAVGYQAEDFTRITVTPRLISSIDSITVQAFGEDKHQVISQLLGQTVDPKIQPAQLLKQAKDSTLFSDYQYLQ